MRDTGPYRAALRRAFYSRKRGHITYYHQIGKETLVTLPAVLLALARDSMRVPRKTIANMNYHGFDVEVGATYAQAVKVVLGSIGTN